MVMSKLKKNMLKYLIAFIVIIVICIFGYKIVKQITGDYYENLVEMGYIENSKVYTGYLVKEETVIDTDSSKNSVPIVSEGQRASKGQTIAVYNGDEYIRSTEKLAEMDNGILEAMKDLPETYVAEVRNMDSEILGNIKGIEQETSYVEIQDTKSMVNVLLNKRARTVAENSSQGSTVKSLITARNEYEKSTKLSEDNIKATVGGVISYKLDGLETNKVFNNLGAISVSDIKENIKSEDVSNGIKVVNNYEAYILVEVKDVDKKYLEVGKTNTIRMVGLKDVELEGMIYRVRELDENSYEVMYKITNKIEELVSLREIEIEIVWVSSYGLYVPNEAIKEKDDVNYVTVIRYGEYIDVPVNVTRKNDKFCIIANIEDKKQVKGTWEDYNIKVYDQLVINGARDKNK